MAAGHRARKDPFTCLRRETSKFQLYWTSEFWTQSQYKTLTDGPCLRNLASPKLQRLKCDNQSIRSLGHGKVSGIKLSWHFLATFTLRTRREFISVNTT